MGASDDLLNVSFSVRSSQLVSSLSLDDIRTAPRTPEQISPAHVYPAQISPAHSRHLRGLENRGKMNTFFRQASPTNRSLDKWNMWREMSVISVQTDNPLNRRQRLLGYSNVTDKTYQSRNTRQYTETKIILRVKIILKVEMIQQTFQYKISNYLHQATKYHYMLPQ